MTISSKQINALIQSSKIAEELQFGDFVRHVGGGILISFIRSGKETEEV